MIKKLTIPCKFFYKTFVDCRNQALKAPKVQMSSAIVLT